jgi:hypothetical protein
MLRSQIGRRLMPWRYDPYRLSNAFVAVLCGFCLVAAMVFAFGPDSAPTDGVADTEDADDPVAG